MKRSGILIGTFVLALAMSLFVAGCGDDGSSSTPAPATGTLSGTATDNSANPLDNYVRLSIAPSGGGTATNVQTNASGAYSASLPAGDYRLTATRPGYGEHASGTLTVTAAQTTTHDFSLTPLPPNTYIGSADCGVCHAANYGTFVKTGHNFKLNKVVNATVPTFPFSTIDGALERITGTSNTLGAPASYANVTYVIGGYGWKARWMDAAGYIITGTQVQYNLATKTMSAYDNGVVNKPYDCGNCHVTGWKHFDAALNPNRQDNLAGIDGTFDQTGIQCESCHGAGSTHARTMLAADITRVATARTTADFLAADMAYGKAVACSECHTRDGEKDYPAYVSPFTDNSALDIPGGRIMAKGGLIEHHEQYDELLGVDPDDTAGGSTHTAAFQATKLGCTSCHNTHTTTKYQTVSGDLRGAANTNADCLACHPTYAITTGGMTGLNCIDCHMPFLVKSAVNSGTFTGSDNVVRNLGDIRSHIFRIDLTQANQFTASGGFAYPWITGDYACRRCHSPGGGAHTISFPNALTIH